MCSVVVTFYSCTALPGPSLMPHNRFLNSHPHAHPRPHVAAPGHIILLHAPCTFIQRITPPQPTCNLLQLAATRISLYAPSDPNSAVHSAFRFKSSPLTVGRDALIARTKSLTTSGGSSSFSESTSTHVISIAPGSPGEQGVSFSPSSVWT